MYTVKTITSICTVSYACNDEIAGLLTMTRLIIQGKDDEFPLLRTELWRNDNAKPIQVFDLAGVSEYSAADNALIIAGQQARDVRNYGYRRRA